MYSVQFEFGLELGFRYLSGISTVWQWRLMEEGDVKLTVGRLALEAKRNVEASSAASRDPSILGNSKTIDFVKVSMWSSFMLFGMSVLS